ncbi:MAG: DNA polymerase IV [Deltaproteobacteria bacterium]|nr:DNA polymerase IV [Deltaproteobacteria bacterium]
MSSPTHKSIIHLDMDAFYASVEVLDHPDLKGRPVIVGGSTNRGVVSAASYEARKYGVHSALPIVTARRLCPHGVFLPVRMSRYKEISTCIFEIFRRFTPLVEPLSLDEAFLDVTASAALFGSAVEIAQEIRRLVRTEIGLTVSAGVAPSKLVAKIASDLNKPDGLTIIAPQNVSSFMSSLPLTKLWGVGRATQKALNLLGMETVGDVARAPRQLLERRFGPHGRQLKLLAQGFDERDVNPEREIKSIGAEETYPVDLLDIEAARRELLWLTTRVSRRLRRNGFICRTVTLKVKYSDFTQITRAESLPRPTDESKQIYQSLGRLIAKTAVGQRPVRLLGVSLSGLTAPEEAEAPSLFEELRPSSRPHQLNQALDRITQKYGERAILPATLLKED